MESIHKDALCVGGMIIAVLGAVLGLSFAAQWLMNNYPRIGLSIGGLLVFVGVCYLGAGRWNDPEPPNPEGWM